MERDGIERLLPTMYQLAARPGSPLDALLHAMADLQRPDEALLQSIETVFDPYRTTPEFVPWLTRWIGLDWLVADSDEEHESTPAAIIPIGRLRNVVAVGAELAQWRGTSRGVIEFLRVVTGIDGFTITEPDDRPFHLVVDVPPAAASQAALIERVVDAVKPASTTAELVFIPEPPWPAPVDPPEIARGTCPDDDPTARRNLMSIWQIGESGTEIPLDDDGQGEVSFTVTNNGTAQDRAVLTVTPLDGAAHEWFTVPEPQKAVAATQSAAFACKVKVPAGTPPATYALQAVVYSADSTPDETSTTSRRVTFTVAAEPAEPKARIPWWVFAIIGAVVLAVIAVVLAFVLRDDSDEATVTNVEPPVITGTPQVGALLEVDIGTWSVARSELTPSFQWERCTGADDASCQSIDEARTAQYVAAIEDEGMTLRAIVGVRPKQESDTSSTVTSLPDADAVAPVASATSQRTEVVGPPAEPDPQAVPNVVGLLVSQATAALTPPALPFQVALLTAGDAVATCDPVVEDQDPDAGTSLAPGSKVTLSVRPTGFIFCGVILEGPILLDPALFPGLVESQP